MNHPKIKHAISGEPDVGSQIPWSPAGELRLRQRITAHSFTMWVFFLFGLVDLAEAFLPPKKNLPLVYMIIGVVLLLCGIVNLFFLGQCRDRLGEEMRRLPNGDWFPGSGMLANKPRSTSTLTEWYQHPPGSLSLICPGCGTTLDFKKMGEWIPNHDPDQRADGTFPDIDPGGGRWVILCACGVGHYKLRG